MADLSIINCLDYNPKRDMQILSNSREINIDGMACNSSTDY